MVWTFVKLVWPLFNKSGQPADVLFTFLFLFFLFIFFSGEGGFNLSGRDSGEEEEEEEHLIISHLFLLSRKKKKKEEKRKKSLAKPSRNCSFVVFFFGWPRHLCARRSPSEFFRKWLKGTKLWKKEKKKKKKTKKKQEEEDRAGPARTTHTHARTDMCVCRFFLFSFVKGTGGSWRKMLPNSISSACRRASIFDEFASGSFAAVCSSSSYWERPTARPQLTPPVESVVVFLSSPVPLIFFDFFILIFRLVVWQIGANGKRTKGGGVHKGGGCEK